MDVKATNAILAVAISLPFGLAWGHTDAPSKTKATVQAVEKPFGRSVDVQKATRTIDIDMSDTMRFAPAALTVNRGETVRFRVKNSGKTLHEMVLGTMSGLKEHAELMRKFPGMEHDEPYMTHVKPGATGTLAWQFTQPGEFFYGCLIPGHFEAGMIGRITVR